MKSTFSVRIETLGCRLNQVESEALTAQFLQLGFNIFSPSDNLISNELVNLCIVNTCTVTGKAEQKARHLIRMLLKQHINSFIIVTGCYATLETAAIENIDNRVLSFSGKLKDELKEFPFFLKLSLDKIQCFDCEVLKSIVLNFREKAYKESLKIDKKQLFKLSSSTFTFHSRASLKIQDGCNNSCSFCRIRLARGSSVSLPAEEAVKRLQEIESNGIGEAVLTGVNLSQYYDPNHGKFHDLLRLLLENTNSIYIRISSIYPELIDDKILPILENKRICPHFHLSLQSGSDRILNMMNRKYNRKDIFFAVNSLRKVKELPFIGCDIITGFPSETDEDFEQTFSMCENLQFPGIHIFPFSARPGTIGFSMRPKIPERIARQRASKLGILAEKNYKEYLQICNGKRFFAVVEKPVQNKRLQVVTENYLTLPLNKMNSSDTYIGGEGIFIKLENGFACKVL